MNDKSHERDERLSKTLAAWKVDAPLPPRFQEGVWQRIARSGETPGLTPWALFRSWLEAALARRVVAVSYLIVLLAAGLTAGYWSGQQTSRRVEAGLGERYLQSVDPYQMPGGSK
jgi:predicted membrane metal-binding protein